MCPGLASVTEVSQWLATHIHLCRLAEATDVCTVFRAAAVISDCMSHMIKYTDSSTDKHSQLSGGTVVYWLSELHAGPSNTQPVRQQSSMPYSKECSMEQHTQAGCSVDMRQLLNIATSSVTARQQQATGPCLLPDRLACGEEALQCLAAACQQGLALAGN
jgi:hypothetical protein